MEIVDININDIHLSEYNPRIMSGKNYERLSKNIEKFGLVSPIIVNLKNNHIIGGHQRYKVLTEKEITDLSMIKLNDIGWVFPSQELIIETEEDEKLLNVALNKISGEFDNLKLSNLLSDLTEKGFDASLSGFNESELKEFSSFDLDVGLDPISFEEMEYETDFTEDDIIDAPDEELEEYETEDDEIKVHNYYDIIFNDEEEQSNWLNIISVIKTKYPEEDISSAILSVIGDFDG